MEAVAQNEQIQSAVEVVPAPKPETLQPSPEKI